MTAIWRQPLLVLAPIWPLLLIAGLLLRPLRQRIGWCLIAAPVPGLLAATLAVGAPPLVLAGGLAPFRLVLDLPGALLLGAAALLWIAAGAYAAADLPQDPRRLRFVVCWLLTLAGSVGVFVTDDLAGFFLAYTLVSIPAYGLVVHDGSAASGRAGAIYIGFALLGETLLLLGFVLLAAPLGGGGPGAELGVHESAAMLVTSPWRAPVLAWLIVGFGMKIGLLPVHMWMPITYRAAPFAAAAVLSGAAVKAGVIGLIRFLPLAAAAPGWGEALTVVGLVGAFYGAALGLTQADPKTILAYSSISQMGLIAATIGMGWRYGDASVAIAVAFYGATHVLAKGGLFLALGAAPAGQPRWSWLVSWPAAIVALGIGGLPLTGGALAKVAVKGVLGSGFVASLAKIAAIGSVLLMLHFLARAACVAAGREHQSVVRVRSAAWLGVAAASIALPWITFPLVAGTLSSALSLDAIWTSLWPVLVGFALTATFGRYRRALPAVPAGDLIALGTPLLRAFRVCGDAFASAETVLRRWPVATLAVLVVAIALAVGMLGRR